MNIPNDYVRFFDTTLRDGEQSPGATMTSEEKLEVARALSRLGVDVIEAGFPAASPDDLAAVQKIAETVGRDVPDGRPLRPDATGKDSAEPPIIAGLARTHERDIEKAYLAVKGAKHPRIHTFLATSPVHREHKLKMSREQVLERAVSMVTLAKSMCDDIEFSPEDAGRTEPEFLYEVLNAVIEAGATTLNIPDTVGYTMPTELGALIAGIKANVVGINNCVISVHCHNDLGLATANTLAGILSGARQVEVTINGIGERAGNSALEEVVMALKTRKPVFGMRTGIDTTQLGRSSRLVSSRTGMVVQPNKAIVGANAFAHESGIHQDGMLKNAETYEIMRPEDVGAAKTLLVLGKHSGRHAFDNRLKELGVGLNAHALESAFTRFKSLADKKKQITDADLMALASSESADVPESYRFESVHVSAGSGMPTASVRLRGPNGEDLVTAAIGTGPVHAIFTAVDDLVKAPAELLEYSIKAVTEGIDALGEASVRIRLKSQALRENAQMGNSRSPVFHGHAADSDILVASIKAYLSAINRLLAVMDAKRSDDETVPHTVTSGV
jgi:2-isopropylmalate synthase